MIIQFFLKVTKYWSTISDIIGSCSTYKHTKYESNFKEITDFQFYKVTTFLDTMKQKDMLEVWMNSFQC